MWIPCGFHVDSMDSTWNKSVPHGFHVECGGMVKYCLQGLQGIREAEVSKYNKVKNTDSAYNGQCSRGRGFLKNLVMKRKKDEANGPINDGICTALLAKAFDDGPPNKYSALALEMFIVQKCFNEGCGEGTADSISSAFAALWDNMYVNKDLLIQNFTDLKQRRRELRR